MQRAPYVEELAPGAFAYVQPDGSWMINNTGFVVGQSGRSVLVDSSSTESRTRAFLAEVDSRSSAAPMALVNTHHHPDHTYGNWLAADGIPVVAHEQCRAELLLSGLEAIEVIREPAYGEVRLRPPDVTFSSTLTLHLDETRLELLHVGPAHTSNDVVVWLPEQRCLFAGDVAFAGAQPFLLEGSLAGFAEALSRVRELEPEVLVPGHGPVCRGDEVSTLLDDLDSYVAWLGEIARAGLAERLPPLQLAERHRDNPFAHWQEPERLVGNLYRACSELSGNAVDRRIRVPDVWPDMVAFHGGPIRCLA